MRSQMKIGHLIDPQFRYECSCGKKTNDTNEAQYHSLLANHRVEIVNPHISWRAEYECGCWYTPEAEHHCDKHKPTRIPR